MSGTSRPSDVADGVSAEIVLDCLTREGFNFFVGVPCSYFGRLIHLLEGGAAGPYVSAVREDSAIGIAAGAYLGGRQPAVLMQNSGFVVSLNALASLNLIYQIPALLIVTWRGEHGADAPEHVIVGERLTQFIDLLGLEYAVAEPSRLPEQLATLRERMHRTARPVVLVVRRGLLQ